MAEKLSITIFLEGAAEIERQLEGIGAAGTKAFDAIGTAAEKAGGFEKLDPKDVTAKLEQFGVKGKAAIDKITAAVAAAGRLERIVGGVRQVEAGFASIGVAAGAMSQRVGTAVTAAAAGMSTLAAGASRVARSFGLIGRLGTGGLVVGLGASVVGMEKAADAARILEGNLQALFRSESGGTAFFNQIQQAAQNAGSSLESTAQTMTAIVKELQKAFAAKGFRFAPGEGLKQSADIAAQAFDTLQKGMQLSGARADDAAKAIKALFAEISKNQPTAGDTFEQASQKAKAMADVLRKLAAEFPQLANELVKFLGTPGQTMDQLADQVEKGIRKIDIPKFLNALTRATPEIEKLREAFDPTLGQRMDAISGAWDRLLNSFGKSPAGAAIKGVLDDIAKSLDEIAKKQEQVGKFTVDKPPATVTGGLFQQMFQEFNQNIEIAKQNWETLKTKLKDPIKLALDFSNLTPVGLALNAVLKLIEKLKESEKDKIKVPFEADPEPPWVQAYLTAIENVKDKFRNMFKTEAEGPPQQPAWVEAYLGWIAKVKAAFLDMFTKRPEVGGSLGGGAVPLMGLPPELQDIGAARIEDRRSPQLEAMRAAAQAVFTQIEQMGTAAFAAIAAAAQQAASAVQSAFEQAISWDAISSAGVAAFNEVVGAVQQASSAIQQFASSLSSVTWDAVSAGATAWNTVTQAIREATNALGQYNATAASSGFAGGGPVAGFQRGGVLGGRGTGTSDSNLAWFSRGEYLVPARAVRQPGVLSFLEALRRSGGSLRDVLDDMGRFALGGLVPRTMPAFATGGLAGGGMSNVTIQFPGLPPIEGLRASEKVIDELRKSAALAQVRSGGRKPSRYT